MLSPKQKCGYKLMTLRRPILPGKLFPCGRERSLHNPHVERYLRSLSSILAELLMFGVGETKIETQLKDAARGDRVIFLACFWSSHAGIIPPMEVGSQIRRRWMNRPAHEMHMGLAEWIGATGTGVIVPVESPAKVEPALSLPLTASGRGRHTPGQMNGLEKRYAAHLDIQKITKHIIDWQFEAIKLKLAPSTFYNPDFLVQNAEGGIELHETKGHWEDDSRVKIKVAARMFPMFKFFGVMWNENSKSWVYEEFHP